MMLSKATTRRPNAATGITSARQRFERRAAAARRRPRVLASIAVGLLLLVGLIAWLGWYSPVLSTESVQVDGVSEGQAQRLRTLAAVPLGGPLLRVDTDAVTERIRADRQWTDVRVERRLPHTLVVTARPRQPALAVRARSGRVEVVDRSGFTFRTVTTPPDGVPLVTAADGPVTPEGVTAALQALTSLDPGLRTSVSGVRVGAADLVTFSLTVKGTRKTVVWGGPGDAATKARLVAILVRQPGSTVDVSVPSAPVTR